MHRRVAIGLALTLLCAPWAGADWRKENKVDEGGGYRLKAMLNSRHQGPHRAGGVWGKDWIVVLLKKSGAPPGQPAQIKGWFQTPFSDITTGVGQAVAWGDNIWFHGGIDIAKGKYKTWGHGVLVGSGQTKAAHLCAPLLGTRHVAVSSQDKLALDWYGGAGPTPLVRDVQEGGEPALDANEEIVWNGDDPVWNIPPVPAVRLTCSLEYQGAGVVRYTYSVENLTSEQRTFSLPEITTTAYPAGWSGALDAFSSASTAVDDDPSDAVWSQNCLGTFGVTGDPDREVLRTSRIYVPTSRLATQIETTITAAGYDPLRAANVVHFELSEPAEGAVLLRITDEEEESFELVAELAGPLASGVPLEFEDPDYPVGMNRYSVMAGTGVNGHRSAELAVSSP